MTPTKIVLLAVVVAFLAGLLGGQISTQKNNVKEESGVQESVYQRVMRTKTLRCGYTIWPPFFEKETTTGKIKGFYYDLTNEMAKSLELKVEWVEEVPLSDFVTALDSDRIDMMCTLISPVPHRTRYAYFSRNHLYAPLNIYTQSGTTRFDDNQQAINDPAVKISVMEGELAGILADTLFPKATKLETTTIQGAAQTMENVATGKADVVFKDPFTFAGYDKNNPGKLQRVQGADIGVFAAAYAMKRGEDEFKWMVDSTLNDLLNRNYLKKLAEDYQLGRFGVYLPADGYKR
jgi:ABC-type amino acid transport substrate-binding protein